MSPIDRTIVAALQVVINVSISIYLSSHEVNTFISVNKQNYTRSLDYKSIFPIIIGRILTEIIQSAQCTLTNIGATVRLETVPGPVLHRGGWGCTQQQQQQQHRSHLHSVNCSATPALLVTSQPLHHKNFNNCSISYRI